MQSKLLSSGFTLAEILVTLAVFCILSLLAYPAYTSYINNARLKEAQGVLIGNARFMEQFYTQHRSFKQTSITWPELPVSATHHFCIKPQGNARGANTEKFTLKAVALDKTQESRVVKINEAHQIIVCESSSSVCDDSAFFSAANGTDKQCTVVH